MTKTQKQKRSLDKIIKDSFRRQTEFNRQTYRETFEKLMRRNKEKYSPTGGRLPFGKSKNETENRNGR